MHFTPENIVEILKSLTLLVGAIAGCIAAWQSSRAKEHGKVNTTKIDTLTDQVNGRMGELLQVTREAGYVAGSEAEKANQQNGEGTK